MLAGTKPAHTVISLPPALNNKNAPCGAFLILQHHFMCCDKNCNLRQISSRFMVLGVIRAFINSTAVRICSALYFFCIIFSSLNGRYRTVLIILRMYGFVWNCGIISSAPQSINVLPIRLSEWSYTLYHLNCSYGGLGNPSRLPSASLHIRYRSPR